MRIEKKKIKKKKNLPSLTRTKNKRIVSPPLTNANLRSLSFTEKKGDVRQGFSDRSGG